MADFQALSRVLHHLAAYHNAAEECVRSGDFGHSRFSYDPQVHLRGKAREERGPELRAAVDKAGRALDEATAVCRSWSAAPPAIRPESTAMARWYFQERLIPALKSCIDEAMRAELGADFPRVASS